MKKFEKFIVGAIILSGLTVGGASMVKGLVEKAYSNYHYPENNNIQSKNYNNIQLEDSCGISLDEIVRRAKEVCDEGTPLKENKINYCHNDGISIVVRAGEDKKFMEKYLLENKFNYSNNTQSKNKSCNEYL